MRSLTNVFVLLFTFFTSFQIFAQIPLSDDAKVTLLTCGRGEELYATFGHTAIRVADLNRGVDYVYNFGTFDFSTPNFYLKFVKGDLQYFVSVTSYREFLAEYEYYGRWVNEQELNISQQQKQDIFNELNGILNSDKKYYTYKFIDRNCTTMVADIIAANIDGKISNETTDKGKTNREILYSYIQGNHFYENLGINLMFGLKTDKMSDKLFLPEELMQGVDNTTINGEPLAKPIETVNPDSEKRPGFNFWNSFYSFAIVILLLVLATSNRVIRLSYIVINGLIGIFFCFVGFYSLHSEITQNYNALLINPLLLVIAFFALRKSKKGVLLTSYLTLLCFGGYLLFMINKPHLFIVLPLVVLSSIVVLREMRR